MITFTLAIVLLVAGYLLYGRLVERIFGVDKNRPTPVKTMEDGVDYIPMKPWKIFLIQFLNIAGVGPIFGAIMGVQFGSSSFLWIVFGSIFAGAVHDYISGMLSIRNGGCSLPEIHGMYLGERMKKVMLGLMVVLLVITGAVFVSAPAELLKELTSWDFYIWAVIIFLYYVIATLLPIDKIIGRIYPLFGFCILFMVVGIMCCIFFYHPQLPEIWDGLSNKHPQADTMPIFPMMFISIACGALSGFHATQSPMMARCMTNEKQGRPIFYGAMISEGIVALVWAAAATAFIHEPACQGVGAATLVDHICSSWLGTVGSILALLGGVAAPITTGDTALRSARLIVADFLHYEQKNTKSRLLVAIPIFAASFGVLLFSLRSPGGFDMIWRYFAWTNQILATVTLWALSVYLYREKKCFYITLLPAIFMTMVVSSYIFIAQKEGFGLAPMVAYSIAAVITLSLLVLFVVKMRNKVGSKK